MLQKFLHHPSDIYLFDNEYSYSSDINGDNSLVVVSQSAFAHNPNIQKHIPQGADIHVRCSGLPSAQEIADLYQEKTYKQVIGIGGGSVMDVTKAYTALLASRGEYSLKDLIEKNDLLYGYISHRSEIKLRLIPTLFGSSAELTRWCSIWFRNEGKKVSLTHPSIYADQVVYDPTLCASANVHDIIITALDCLAHAVEACWNLHHNFITDQFALEAIQLTVQTLLEGFSSLADSTKAHSNLAKAAVFSGLAFSQNGTSIAHALSYPLTIAGLPHGLASSVFLGNILEKLALLRPGIYRKIETIFSENGFSVDIGISAAYYEFYKCCGGLELVRMHNLNNFDPRQAAINASGYDKFDRSLTKLSTTEAIELYKTLLSFYR